MFYVAIVILGVVLTAIALRKKKGYLAGVGAFSTATFAIAWPAYHFFSWATLWLLATMAALVWTISIRNALSRIAFIVCAGVFTVLALGAGSWVLLFVILAAILAGVEGVYRNTITKVLAASAVAAVTLFAAVSGNPVAPSIFGTAVAADATPQDLAIKPGELLPDAAKCGTDDKFNRNSMPGTPGRVWSDSVSTPFKATDKDAQFTELTSEICVNPTLGDAYIKALSDAKIGDFSVAQANPWMKEFLDKSDGKDGLKVWLTHTASDPKGIHVTDTNAGNYQYYAQMTNAVLFVLNNQGTKTATSTVNWPLASLASVDTLPRVYKDTKKQEGLPFLALTFTQKAGGCPYVLGVNLKDKRAEEFGCEQAKEIAPPTPTKRKPPVITPSHPSSTPTKPGHTPSSTPTPTPSHSTPGTCVWKNGTVHNLDHGLCPKDPGVIPSNPNHTPAGHPTEPASSPSHPAQTANPSTKPGSGSTQTAPGATKPPAQSSPAPTAGTSNQPSSPATGCVDPDTGKAC